MPRLDVSSLSDRELVLFSQARGDRHAFGELVSRHQRSLRAFLWRLSGDFALADDLAQDAFMRSFDRLGSLREADSFRPWLFSIAYREFIHSSRKAKVYRRFLRQVAKGDSQVEPHSDASLDLQNCLKVLTPAERAALLLCDACGMSHNEASIALGAPLGSVKTYVQRAREKVRTALTAVSECPEPGTERIANA